jgi:hypothetical protein
VDVPRHIDRRAARARDAAHRRVRRVTGLILAASVAAAGTIASYVAGAASGRKAVTTSGQTTSASARKITRVPVPATPAAPALHSSSSLPSPAPSVSPPVQSASPPIAVSGGS